MTPFEAYKMFMALKMHFTQPSYDYFKYNGKTNASVQTYEKRRDKFYFAKLSRHKDPMGYLVAQFIDSSNPKWIGDFFGETADGLYNDYLARHQSLSYRFSLDLQTIEEDFIEHFKVKDGQHPSLLGLLKRNSITLETFTILNDNLKFFDLWDSKISETVLWPTIRDRSLKYRPFIHYDSPKIKSLIRGVMAQYRAK